ncbi:EamA family transporter [Niallia sp. 03133]|uniref:EamA family transporter n=1 Tax=Niallia sp. 03133 TaxID=3458060 RepID=UPI00404426EC
MQKWKYSLLVLAGGVCYGLLSTIIKLGLKNGFSITELIGGQYIFGWFGLLILTFLGTPYKASKKQWISLLLIAVPMSMTTIAYGFAVKELSVSIAIIFFFQFTWMGVVMEAIVNKKFPSKKKLLSVFTIFAGTLFAAGIFEGDVHKYSIFGIVLGLAAACSFAFYIFFNSRVATEIPAYTKSLIMTTGAMVIICSIFPPTFMVNGAMKDGIWIYALLLGLLGVVLPILLYSVGTPKIGAGLSTILGSIELPTVAVASIMFVHESVTVIQWFGIILILVGILAPNLLSAREEKDAEKVFPA